MRRLRRAWVALLAAAAWPASAQASSALDSPEGGTEQISRGGAWVARADTPMAAFYNPAGLTTQSSGVSLGAQLMLRDHCFTRLGQDGEPLAPAAGFAAPPPDLPTCADITPFPNPQLGINIRLHDQWAIGLAVLGPHLHGITEWPTTLTYQNNFGVDAEVPSPTRYLLVRTEAVFLMPTLAVAFAPIKELSIGAGFTWGIASAEISNVAEAVSGARCANPMAPCPSPGNPQPDDFTNDVLAQVKGFDGFIPGFVVGLLWQPLRVLDVGAWYHFSDSIKTVIDLHAEAPYYESNGRVNDNPSITDVENAGRFKLEIPMEARIGIRYHHPRDGGVAQDWITQHHGWSRDAIAEDLFDVELDLTWAHNSTIDSIDITFGERFPIEGTPGRIPLNASFPHEWNDTIGVRLGGELVPIPDLLALRLGGFFESQAGNEEYLNIDFDASARAGIGGGVGVRLSRFDINVAYQHTFYLGIDNEGAGEVYGVSGDATTDDFRTRQPVNGGRSESSLNEIGLSAAVHW